MELFEGGRSVDNNSELITPIPDGCWKIPPVATSTLEKLAVHGIEMLRVHALRVAVKAYRVSRYGEHIN